MAMRESNQFAGDNRRPSDVPGPRNDDLGDKGPEKLSVGWFVPTWMAEVRSAACRLEAELDRTPCGELDDGEQADYRAVRKAILTAREHAHPSGSRHRDEHFFVLRQLWRHAVVWWTGGEIDLAYCALHTAGQILLSVEPEDTVKAHIPDMAASVITSFRGDDLRVRGYLKTLEILATPGRPIQASDRAQLRAIRQACDSSDASAHSDARTFRNTLVVIGAMLLVLVAGVAGLAWVDQGFRAVFAVAAVAKHGPDRWYVLELEVIGSLSGLAGAALTLKNYTGYRHTYGLPVVQALLKGSAGAATGLLGVLLAGSGFISALSLHPGAQIFAVALIFGYAQYLFTRLLDRQAKDILTSAGSRSDRSVTPQVPASDERASFVTVAYDPHGSGQPGHARRGSM
jgi:hypothetical protein